MTSCSLNTSVPTTQGSNDPYFFGRVACRCGGDYCSGWWFSDGASTNTNAQVRRRTHTRTVAQTLTNARSDAHDTDIKRVWV